MRLQDLKFWRDPLYSYGPGCPRARSPAARPTTTIRATPRTGTTPTSSGPPRRRGRATSSTAARRRSSPNLAKYAECDVKGTLAKFDTNHNNLIEYSVRHAARQRRRLGGVRLLRHQRRRTAPRARSSYSERAGRRGRVHAARQHRQGHRDERHRRQHQDRDPEQPLGRRPGRRGWRGATGPRVTGRIGNAVKLSGSSEYVALPTGVVSGLSNFTISAWVNPAANTTWSRRVRLRHRHHGEHVPDRQRRDRAPVRDHHLGLRR